MGMRMVSMESKSMVYHRPECRYARKIYRKNRMQMTWEDAEYYGYRPCKCCDGINFLFKHDLASIEYFAEKNHMDVDLKDNKIYVRTDVGCWKIIYKTRMQKFILLHRNYVSGRIGLDEVENAPYHRQGDIAQAGSIMKYLKYIQKHDEFKQSMPEDYHQMPRDTKRQKTYYNAAKKRADRRSAKRLDNLFLMIERQEGIKQLSFC